jgi:hypothetical protein
MLKQCYAPAQHWDPGKCSEQIFFITKHVPNKNREPIKLPMTNLFEVLSNLKLLLGLPHPDTLMSMSELAEALHN